MEPENSFWRMHLSCLRLIQKHGCSLSKQLLHQHQPEQDQEPPHKRRKISEAQTKPEDRCDEMPPAGGDLLVTTGQAASERSKKPGSTDRVRQDQRGTECSSAREEADRHAILRLLASESRRHEHRVTPESEGA